MSEVRTRTDPFRPISAVFIDRDDTIIEDTGYINNPKNLKFLPGAADGLKLLSDTGLKLIVISNQSGLARGLISKAQLAQVNNAFIQMLKKAGIRLTDYLYCPYHPEGKVEQYRKDSAERKPSPGMIFHAACEHGIFLPTSWMIGDRDDDIEAGRRAGVRTIKIGKPSKDSNPNFFADNLLKAGKIVSTHIC